MINHKRPSPDIVINQTAHKYGVTPEDILDYGSQIPNIHTIRSEAIFEIYSKCRQDNASSYRLPFQKIGEIMGGRTTESVTAAIQSYKAQNHGGFNVGLH